MKSEPLKTAKNGHFLDTLAQLWNDPQNQPHEPHQKTAKKAPQKGEDLSLKTFIKKQKAKALTNAIVLGMADVDSPLKKSYWNAWHCNNVQLQDGKKIKAKYCNSRWCVVCSRIRTAKMIKGYAPVLLKFKDMQFATLTAPNVKEEDLINEVDRFINVWRKIYYTLRKTYKIKPKGIRKIEITYNWKSDTYNAHFHLIVERAFVAELITNLWLKHNLKAQGIAQDVRKADDGALMELFKYTAKMIHDKKFTPSAMDAIYRALRGKRTYQPFGIKKYVCEDVEGVQTQTITFQPSQREIWVWNKEIRDWINGAGECLTGYIMDGKFDALLNKIESYG